MSVSTAPFSRRGRKARRMTLIAVAGAALALAAALVLYALDEKITFAPTPTELVEGPMAPGTRVRLGGLVETGSVVRGADGQVRFAVTDTVNRVPVTYVGLLPDLFREGQGVVAEGVLGATGQLNADTVLARHDENYAPKEVVDALKAQGAWNEDALTRGHPGPAVTADPAGGAGAAPRATAQSAAPSAIGADLSEGTDAN